MAEGLFFTQARPSGDCEKGCFLDRQEETVANIDVIFIIQLAVTMAMLEE